MTESYIEKEHIFNKNLVNDYDIKIGSIIIIKRHGELKQVTIDRIHSYYYWIENDKIGWILPKEIVSINNINVVSDIMKKRKTMGLY